MSGETFSQQEMNEQFNQIIAANELGAPHAGPEQAINALGNEIVEFSDEELAELYGDSKEYEALSVMTVQNLGAVAVIMTEAAEFKNPQTI